MSKFNYSTFKHIVNDVNTKIKGNFINTITLINSRDFLISFSYHRNEKLLISLNHQNPFLYLINLDESFPTIANSTNEILRKELKDSYIEKVELLNEDRVVVFHLTKSNELFEKEKKKLILELIPQRANLIITKNDIIQFALFETNISSPRIILKGMKYTFLEKSSSFITLDNDEMANKDFANYANNYLYLAKNQRLKERYAKLFKYIKSRQKSLKNKVNNLSQDILVAKNNVIYKEHGNALLSYCNDDDLLNKYIEDNHLIINKDISIGQNANAYFKKYKKAIKTIEMANLEITKSEKEIEKLKCIEAQITYMNDDDLFELSIELLGNKYKVNSKKESKPKLSYVIKEKTKIFFGKNAKQNNEITFNCKNKNFYYLHVKDYHGSHVLIESENPSNEQILTACEICLIMSNQTSGLVMCTQLKNVKKGSSLGEAILNTYKEIKINNIRKETYDLLKTFKN